MKKQTKVLIMWLAIEIVILNMLRLFGVTIDSSLLNILAGFMVLLPVWLLLFFAAKDQKSNNTTRIICKGILWFVSICFIGATLGEVIMNII